MIANIKIPVNVENPGHFFACCGIFELISMIDKDPVYAWWDENNFNIKSNISLSEFISHLKKAEIIPDNEEFIFIINDRKIKINWFLDSKLKTWGGNQNAFDESIKLLNEIKVITELNIWEKIKNKSPFYFDSELGKQSAINLGFSPNDLDGNNISISRWCRPLLELMCLVGLQRFLLKQIDDKFEYSIWRDPLIVTVASAVACKSIKIKNVTPYEFQLLYRGKYYKSFLHAQMVRFNEAGPVER